MDFKLKIKSKKLESGKYQVRFSTQGFRSDYYGYILAEPRMSVREVVEMIQDHLGAIQDATRYFQSNLFSLGKRQMNTGHVLLFRSPEEQIPSQNQLHYANQ